MLLKCWSIIVFDLKTRKNCRKKNVSWKVLLFLSRLWIVIGQYHIWSFLVQHDCLLEWSKWIGLVDAQLVSFQCEQQEKVHMVSISSLHPSRRSASVKYKKDIALNPFILSQDWLRRHKQAAAISLDKKDKRREREEKYKKWGDN